MYGRTGMPAGSVVSVVTCCIKQSAQIRKFVRFGCFAAVSGQTVFVDFYA